MTEEPFFVKISFKRFSESAVRIVQPDKTGIELPLKSSAVEEKRTASFRPTQLGPHRVVAQRVKSTDHRVFARQFIDVVPNNHELETTRTNPDLLRTLAENAGGTFSSGSSQTFDASILGNLSAEFIEYRESSIWDRWWFLLSLALLLGLEWFLRRKWGLA